MENDTLTFKKYTIKTIVNPGKFYAVEYGKENQNKVKQHILQRDVKKFRHLGEIHIGQIVAVKCQTELHRGLVTDIYNRYFKPIFCVLLVDRGINIETCADSIFMIRTPELRNKKLNACEIVLHGIQPVTIKILVSSVDLESNVIRDNLDGILHKRKSNKWSPAAFKFIEDLFKTNKCIYVNCIDTNGAMIIGDVYYRLGGDGELTSLAQTLCDKDFVIYCKNWSTITEWNSILGDKYSESIERRIPHIPEDAEWQELLVPNPARPGTEEGFSSSESSSCSGSERILKKLEDKTNGLETCSFSPSWILKKMSSFSPTTPSESCQPAGQTERTSPKVHLFRVVQRNVQLYDKHKLSS